MRLTTAQTSMLTRIYLADVCDVTFSGGVVLDGKRLRGAWAATLSDLLDAGLLGEWRGGWVLTDAGLDVMRGL